MGGILLYVIGIIFHWLYCKCLFYRNILLSKCSDPSSHTLPVLVLLCCCLSLSAWCIGAEKAQTQVKCQPTSDSSPEPEWGAGSKTWKSPEEEAPPPHPAFRLPLKTLGFPIYGHTEICFFQKKGVKITESNIWLMREAKNMSKSLVQLWNHNDDKYNEIRMEKVIPSR